MKVKQLSIGNELIATGKQSTTVMYRLVKLCGQFSESTEWAFDGFPTAAHWIATRLDVEVRTAREWIRIGKCLEGLPVCDLAFRDQLLSYSKVRNLTRVATPSNESELVEIARFVPAGRLNHALASWSMNNEDPQDIDDRHQRQRGVFVSTQPDGSFLGIVKLPPLDGGKFLRPIDASVMRNRPHASADAPSLAQQRADALVRLLTEGSSTVATEVIVHVRGDGCFLDDGTPVAESVVEQIAPTSFIRALIHDAESRPINASGRHRHPTMRQKRVVKERDRCCVDCGSSDFEEYDHDPDFDISRRTVIDELFLRCSRCHARRHREAENW